MIDRNFLKRWHACYSNEQIDALIPVGGCITAQALITDQRVPLIDRLWVLCRLLADKDVQLCVKLAEHCRDKAATVGATWDAAYNKSMQESLAFALVLLEGEQSEQSTTPT